MSELDLDAIEKRVKAATEGFPPDWDVKFVVFPYEGRKCVIQYDHQDIYQAVVMTFLSEGPKILADAPALIEEVKALRDQRKELWLAIKSIHPQAHYCPEWDDLLIHPGMGEWDSCSCEIKARIAGEE